MDSINERIKKLLRLARDKAATPAEAAAALSKAQAIAEANGRELPADPGESPDPKRNVLSHHRVETASGYAERKAAWLITVQFPVKFIWGWGGLSESRRAIYFIGPPCFVEIAGYCHTYLRRTMAMAWRKRANKRLKNRRAFIDGFAAAIYEQMPEEFRGRGLVEIDAAAYFITHIKPGATLSKMGQLSARASSASLTAGWIAGKRHAIRNALEG